MASRFHTTRRVEFADTDAAGIIHFAAFFRYMEEAEHAFFRSLGLSILMRQGEEVISWPRVSATCDFLGPVGFEDVLDIDLAVRRKGTSSMTYAFAFSKDGTVIARGQTTAVCCRVGPGHRLEKIAIPAAIAEKLEEEPFQEGTRE